MEEEGSIQGRDFKKKGGGYFLSCLLKKGGLPATRDFSLSPPNVQEWVDFQSIFYYKAVARHPCIQVTMELGNVSLKCGGREWGFIIIIPLHLEADKWADCSSHWTFHSCFLGFISDKNLSVYSGIVVRTPTAKEWTSLFISFRFKFIYLLSAY